jgi:O-antigen ligase
MTETPMPTVTRTRPTPVAFQASMPRARARVAPRAPWLAYIILWALCAALGPYDLNNRADREDVVIGDPAVLKAEAVTSGETIATGDIGRRVAVITLGLFASWLLWRARRRGTITGVVARPLVGAERWLAAAVIGYILVVTASIGWADDPGLAARRIVVFLVLSLTAYTLARVWSLVDFLRFVALGCASVLIASVAVEIVHHAFQPLAADYRLSGLTHANIHAVEAAVLILSALALARMEPERRRRYWTLAGIGLVMLLLTRSRTSVAGVVAGLAAVPLLTMSRRRLLVVLLAGSVAALLVGVFLPDLLADPRGFLLLGRTAATADVGTMTGRTDIWRALLVYIAERPVLGYGFGSFWTPERMEAVSLELGWLVPHAHSTYVETQLELGAVGLACFVSAIVLGIGIAARGVLRTMRTGLSLESAFAFTVLVWLTVSMFAEVMLPMTEYGSLVAMVLLAWMATGGSGVLAIGPAARRSFG